ncbi:MAG: hypothetical protein NC548_38075 [Lachnospiraceae bacterium]|nr:hypothetical protein [Bacteroides fragilis]MCM1220307.1 hypothetical protein [Lachnospiraceae bacterium]
MDYIDLLLIYEPAGNVREICRAMENAYKDGKLRTLLEISGNHDKSVAQIALRFLLQQGIIVILKSIHAERMKENYAVLIWKLMGCRKLNSLKWVRVYLAGGKIRNITG